MCHQNPNNKIHTNILDNLQIEEIIIKLISFALHGEDYFIAVESLAIQQRAKYVSSCNSLSFWMISRLP